MRAPFFGISIALVILELTFFWVLWRGDGHLMIVMNMICDMMGYENE